MKKVVNKFKETRKKNLLVIVSIFGLIFASSSLIFFNDYKTNLLQEYLKDYKINIKYLNSRLDNTLFSNNKIELENAMTQVSDTGLFKKISLEYKSFIFDKSTLIDNTPSFNDKSWKLAEVTVDARSGYIKKLRESSLYEFVPSDLYETNQDIVIRYQVYKKGEIRNFLIKLAFNNIEKNIKREESYILPFINNLAQINIEENTYDIVVDRKLVATVFYEVDKYNLLSQLQSFTINLFVFTFIMFSPIIFLIVFYHKYIFSRYVTQPIDYLNKYLDDIISNRYQVMKKDNFEGTDEIVELTKKVNKISSKIASLTNELNASKESLEKRNTTDSLTGLPNKVVFDFDIKGMFVSATKAYIYLIKIDELGKLSAKYDNGYINSFIESYVNTIKNVIYKYSKTDMKIYRFYGSEFAIVSKGENLEQTKDICEEIVEELLDRMPDFFDTPANLVQIGVSYFDLYGSIDSITKSLHDAYDIAKEKGNNSYHIVSEEDVEKNYSLLDNSVLNVIKTGGFDIKFMLDTFTFDNPNDIAMKEVSPVVFDHEDKKISIGSFVAVAQKLDIVDKFDKLVIEKAVEHLKETNADYSLAINLAIDSIKNQKFMNWIEEYLKENENIMDKIVFSITSYTAYSHKADFVTFVREIKDIGAKVLLKRYKTEEFPLEQLENVGIDYIRMNKDYTVNFTNDPVKRHKVKNILIFGDLNSIEIIADSVTVENDYNMLERLGAYASTK